MNKNIALDGKNTTVTPGQVRDLKEGVLRAHELEGGVWRRQLFHKSSLDLHQFSVADGTLQLTSISNRSAHTTLYITVHNLLILSHSALKAHLSLVARGNPAVSHGGGSQTG